MIKKYKILLLTLAFVTVSTGLYSQQTWTLVKENTAIVEKDVSYRVSKPITYNLYAVDNSILTNRLRKKVASKNRSTIIELPTPNGIQRFKLTEASVLSEALARQFPTIKSYVGVGLDDPTARVRLSKSKVGVHAMISSGNYPMFLIDPYTKDKKTSIGYFKNQVPKNKFECLVEEKMASTQQSKSQKIANANDGKLRTYRLAVVTTGEYSQFHLNQQGVAASATDAVKKAAVLSAINTTMTRVNGVFERDLGVTMQLVANNTSIIFLDAATDGLTDNDANDLIDETQAKCDAVIGNSNYDIGHAFSTGGGGLAGLGVVCETGQKATGITGSSSPINDTFDIDFVAHEIGHQFGANHTQNNDCQRNNGTAVEPGSASTIMGYAGICSPDVQNNSDAYFHAVSIAEMWNVVITTATCGVETATNNATPVANAGSDVSIPKSTPFILKGIGTDVDASDALTYNWEQIDNQSGFMPPQSTNTVGPMFRSLPSSNLPDRYMPAQATVLAGNTATTWEVLPSVARTMKFSFTVRDNVANGAASARDDKTITVDGASGPFTMTSFDTKTTINGGSTQTVTWDVANTTSAPVSCSHVNILLSTDGGLTFPNVLKSNTPNDGTEQVVMTNVAAKFARIKIEPVSNIFYAVNSVSFSIDHVAGIDDLQFTNFMLYPNPSNGTVKVSFETISSDDVSIQLFDLTGRKVVEHLYQNRGNLFSEELNFTNIAKGLYVLKIQNGTHKMSKKMLLD